MTSNRPAWYDDLKQKPLKTAPRLTPAMLDAMRQRSKGRTGMPYRKSAALPLICLLGLGLIGGVVWESWSPVREEAPPAVAVSPSGNGQTIPGGQEKVPLDGQDAGQVLDRRWLVSIDEFQRYQDYAKDPSDDRLKGLSPLEVFRFYYVASLIGDADTMYALLIKGDDVGTPSREEYLHDLAMDPEWHKRSSKQWQQWKRTLYLIEQIEGDEALILMTGKPDVFQGEQDKVFRLQRDEAGVWKVGWLAMQ